MSVQKYTMKSVHSCIFGDPEGAEKAVADAPFPVSADDHPIAQMYTSLYIYPGRDSPI